MYKKTEALLTSGFLCECFLLRGLGVPHARDSVCISCLILRGGQQCPKLYAIALLGQFWGIINHDDVFVAGVAGGTAYRVSGKLNARNEYGFELPDHRTRVEKQSAPLSPIY